MSVSLPEFPQFRVSGEKNLGVRWKEYVSKLENLFIGLNIESKKRRKALLLHYGGDEIYDIAESLSTNSEELDYDTLKQKLNGYFNPKSNREFETYEFRNMVQEHCETIDQFVTRLKTKAKFCEFSDSEREVKSQLIQGCRSNELRKRALRDDYSLNDLQKFARTLEISESQATEIGKKVQTNGQTASVDRVKSKRTPKFSRNPRPTIHKNQNQPSRQNTKCTNCGGKFST
ncbi:uncharacterized protein LOC123535880 [Mercenaria mercenaria]|uniref:uncharacterized protein LOC123535880 n=1 Tax=Mercenaria mercenaria TaxID=6596 RepID=UPI00234F99ED|nr:uncharacterized protein LOC123535880 [Mercenaria mercenaria]